MWTWLPEITNPQQRQFSAAGGRWQIEAGLGTSSTGHSVIWVGMEGSYVLRATDCSLQAGETHLAARMGLRLCIGTDVFCVVSAGKVTPALAPLLRHRH